MKIMTESSKFSSFPRKNFIEKYSKWEFICLKATFNENLWNEFRFHFSNRNQTDLSTACYPLNSSEFNMFQLSRWFELNRFALRIHQSVIDVLYVINQYWYGSKYMTNVKFIDSLHNFAEFFMQIDKMGTLCA